MQQSTDGVREQGVWQRSPQMELRASDTPQMLCRPHRKLLWKWCAPHCRTRQHSQQGAEVIARTWTATTDGALPQHECFPAHGAIKTGNPKLTRRAGPHPVLALPRPPDHHPRHLPRRVRRLRARRPHPRRCPLPLPHPPTRSASPSGSAHTAHVSRAARDPDVSTTKTTLSPRCMSMCSS